MRPEFIKRQRAFALTGALAAAILISGTVVGIAAGIGSNDYERGQAIAEARQGVSPDLPIIRVGDATISLADFAERRAAVESNIEYMRQQIASNSYGATVIKERLDIIESAGTHDVALASLILDTALYQRAIQEGYAASGAEVQEHISVVRSLVESGEADSAGQGYIEAIGEARYWDEVYPEIAKRDISVEKMRQALIARLKPADRAAEVAAWNDLAREVVMQAQIEVLQPEYVEPGTIQGALRYLDAYWDLDTAQAVGYSGG